MSISSVMAIFVSVMVSNMYFGNVISVDLAISSRDLFVDGVRSITDVDKLHVRSVQ